MVAGRVRVAEGGQIVEREGLALGHSLGVADVERGRHRGQGDLLPPLPEPPTPTESVNQPVEAAENVPSGLVAVTWIVYCPAAGY